MIHKNTMVRPRFPRLVLVLVLPFFIVSCYRADPTVTMVREEPDAAPVTLTMWVRTPETVPLLTESIGRFHQQNPNITINLVEFSADAYPGVLKQAMETRTLPDIFQMHNSAPLARMVSLNHVQFLNSHFSAGFTSQFDPASWWEGSTTVNDLIYVWPDRSFRRGSLFLYTNNQVVQQFGLDPANPPTTWEQLIAQSMGINRQSAGNIAGLTLGFTSEWFNQRLLFQWATTANPYGVPAEHLPGMLINWTTGNLFDSTGLDPAVALFQSLIQSGAMDPDFLGQSRSSALAKWLQGRAGFLVDGSWRLQELLRDHPDLDFTLSYLPGYQGNLALWGVEGGSQNGFAVSRNSPYPQQSVKFFEFLTRDYYPLLLRNSVDLTPIPALNGQKNLYGSDHFFRLVQLTEGNTHVLPSPLLRNPGNIETLNRFAARTISPLLGNALRDFFLANNYRLTGYFTDYQTQLTANLEQAIQEVQQTGFTVNATDWVFPDWNPFQDYQ